MATIDNKAGGGWKGTIGPVIESSWNGIRYLRSKPAHYRDRKSEAQLTQRSKMTLCHEMVRSMLPLVKIGYHAMAVGKSAYNVCMSRNMRCATGGNYPEVQIDYPKVLLGEGPLAVPQEAQAEAVEGRMVIRWQFTPDTGNAEATDKALIAIYNVQRKCSILWLRYARRSATMAEITLPREWVGEHLELFMGFENAAQTWVSNII